MKCKKGHEDHTSLEAVRRCEMDAAVADPLSGMNPIERAWVVSIAEGFRRAGCLRAPIVPDPEVIKECILTLERADSTVPRNHLLAWLLRWRDQMPREAAEALASRLNATLP